MALKPFRWLVVIGAALLAILISYAIWCFLGKDVYGVVTDITGRQLPGATVHLGNITVTADNYGFFSVHSFPVSTEITVEWKDETTTLSLPQSKNEIHLYEHTPEPTVPVDWNPPALEIFGPDNSPDFTPQNLLAIQNEINNDYAPKHFITLPNGIQRPFIGMTIPLPVELKNPKLPQLVNPSKFIVNEEGMEVVKGEILVGWKENTTKTDRGSIITKVGASLYYDNPDSRTSIVYTNDQKKVPTLIAELKKTSYVTGAIANYRWQPQEVKPPLNDPDYKDKAKNWWLKNLNTEPMWAMTKGKSVLIAVIDVGFDMSHPDLGSAFTNMGLNYTTDDWLENSDHGTHISGIIAARQNNNQGMTGILPEVRLLPIKIYDIGRLPAMLAQINTYPSVRVASMSMGWNWWSINQKRIEQRFPALTEAEIEQKSSELDRILEPVFQQYYRSGGVLVKSAGNDGIDAKYNGFNFPEVITVAATGEKDQLVDFSNKGAGIDITAPGNNIWSTVRGGNYSYMSGTSTATPMVSATVAAIRSLRPHYGAKAIELLLQKGSIGGGFTNYTDNTSRYTPPRLNAWRVLLRTTNHFGLIGEVQKGIPVSWTPVDPSEHVKEATINSSLPPWYVATDDQGKFIIPFLQRQEQIIKAEKNGNKGEKKAVPPIPRQDEVGNIYIYLEDNEPKKPNQTESPNHLVPALQTNGGPSIIENYGIEK